MNYFLKLLLLLHQAFYGNQELTRFSAQRTELSPSGKYVALVDEDTLRIWSNENYSYVSIQHQFTFDEDQVIQNLAIDFNPSETQVMLSRYLSREVVKEDEVFGTTIIETVRDQHEARAWSLEGQEVEIDPLIRSFTPNDDLAFTQSGLLRLSDSKQFDLPQYSQIKFSSDGKKIAWEHNGKLKIAAVEDLDQVEPSDEQSFDNEVEPIELLGFIGDDQFVLVRAEFDNLAKEYKYQILDLSGNFIKDIYLTTSPEGCIGEAGDEMLSPRGNFFIVRCRNGNISIQEIGLSDSAKPLAQQLINVFEISNVSSDGFSSSSISMSHDEARMLVSNSEGFRNISKLWMIQKEEIQQPISSDTSEVDILSADISSNSGGVAYVNNSGSVKLFHRGISETQINQIPDELLDLPSNPLVRFSRSGQYFALVHGRRVDLYHEDGSPAIDLNSNPIVLEHDGNVTSVDFDPNESFIVSTDSGGAIKTWNLQGVLVNTLKVSFFITSSAISPDGSSFAISYIDDLQRPRIDIRSLDQQGILGKNVLFAMEDETVTMPDTDRTIAPITEMFFLSNDYLIFSNRNNLYYPPSGFGIKILELHSGNEIHRISTRGSSNARQVGLHSLGNLLTVMIELNAHNPTGVGRLWSIDGEQLSDFRHLHFGQTPRSSFWGCLEDPTYPKCIHEARFSDSGDALTAIVQHDETGEYGVAVWDFNLDTLVDKSCDLLSNYLSSPLATDAERQLCSDESDQGDSQTSETPPNESISDPSTLPWYSLNRWFGSRQGEQLASTPSTEPADGSVETSPTVSENSNFPTLAPPVAQHIDLTGLGLTLNEQVSFQRLNTQALVWDIEGALESLIVLQNSDNQCVATFAEQFTQLLNQQDKEGFRQINPIKEELNETQGCALPLVPFDFSPLSSD
jgi:WD40 repeat protein